MKIFVGKVIATKMAKTATVVVARTVTHPIYKKKLKRERKYQVHDETSSAKVGDVVRFAASRPISKSKRWTLVKEAKKK